MSAKMVLFFIVLLVLGVFGSLYGQDGPVSYLDASVPRPDFWIDPAPAEGSVASTNPPSFRWLIEPNTKSYTLQYSQNREFTGSSTVTVEDLNLNLHHPAKAVKPGKWYWRYRAVSQDGKTSAWSADRTFTIPRDAVRFELPPVEEVLARIPQGRPRLFVTPETLDQVRQARLEEKKEFWQELERRIGDMVDQPVMTEPVPYPDGKWDVDIWREYMVQARAMGNRIEHLAFGYLMTGEKKYFEAAKAQVLEICTWDPAGTSSYRYNDEVGMPIVVSMARVYDWAYDAFTPEERAKIREMMRARSTEVYNMHRGIPYEVKPYNSHATRVLKFLGQSSVAFLGEIDEASEWFTYLMNIFYCIYPPWGDADGSYHEGPSYWSAYFGWAQQFATALKPATEIDLYQKPFFRNTGYWALYCFPPHAAVTGFGDGAAGRTGTGHKINVYRLASVYNDPYLRWYVETIPYKMTPGLVEYFYDDPKTEAKPPTDLPQSRAFYDCGIAAMHSDLANGEEDVYMLLKSDPFGAWSHAYADQNSFYLQAFGEPLVIPSGHYPWYASEHHKQWTWQTKAANSVLVNGEGQITRQESSNGRIAESLFTPRLDYVVTDAVNAYGGRLDKFLRHVVFMRPGYFVMVDELAAKEASTFDWLLHARNEMQLGPDAALITNGDARLHVEFVEPQGLKLSQTDQFTVPPERDLPNQWHLTASTPRKSKTADFVTIMFPYKTEAGNLPSMDRVNSPGVSGVSVKSGDEEDIVLLNRMDSPMIASGITADARLAAVRKSSDGLSTVFMTGGKSLAVNRRELIRADSPVTATMEISTGRRTLTIKCEEPTQLRLPVEVSPKPFARITVRKGVVVEEKADPRIFYGTVKVNGKKLPPTGFRFDHESGVVMFETPAGQSKIEIVRNSLP